MKLLESSTDDLVGNFSLVRLKTPGNLLFADQRNRKTQGESLNFEPVVMLRGKSTDLNIDI